MSLEENVESVSLNVNKKYKWGIVSLIRDDRYSEINSLHRHKYKDLILNYDIEVRSHRSKIVQQITNPAILVEYLELPEQEREEAKEFVEKNKDWKEDSSGHFFKLKENKKYHWILRKQRAVNKIIDIFKEFMKKRVVYENFRLKAIPKNRMVEWCRIRSGHDLDQIMDLAELECPELAVYRDYKEVLKRDGVNELVCLFDEFVKKRKPFEKFSNYVGNKFMNKFSKNEIHCETMYLLASKIRPEISFYNDLKKITKIDAPLEAIRIFKDYKKERKPFENFVSYTLRKKEGHRLYQYAHRQLKNGFKEVLWLACKEEPEIKEYVSEISLFRKDMPKKLAKMILKRSKKEKCFKQINLKDLFNDGERVIFYGQARNYFEGGLWELLFLTAREDPRILKLWNYTPTGKSKKYHWDIRYDV